MKDVKFAIACSAGGAYTQTSKAVLGKLYAIEVVIGTLTNGAADITVSVTNTPSGVDKTLLTLTNITASALYYVRDLMHGETGTALTGTSGGDRCQPLLAGNLKCVVADGGVSTSGTVIVYYEE